MEILERVMDERAADLAASLTDIGFSPTEARRFLVEAGPELAQSYAWQAAGITPDRRRNRDLAGDVLACTPARALAAQTGISLAMTWAGLREVVPAVLAAAERPRRATPGPSTNGARRGGSGARRLDLGFGLSLGGLKPPDTTMPFGAAHPVFGRLLTQE